MAYDRLEPFGAVRDNWHMATLASMYAAAHTRKGKTSPGIDAFMYQNPEEQRDNNARSFIDFLKSKKK